MTESANLPAIVQAQGGAVVEVLSWPQHIEALTRKQQLEVSLIVQTYPGLGTEAGVDLLADAAGHFGERLDRWFASMVDQYGIEQVCMAIEMLDVLGRRGRAGEAAGRDRETERFDLDEMLGIIALLQDIGRPVVTVEGLNASIDRMGGWHLARLLDESLARSLFSGELEIHEVWDIVNESKTDDVRP